MLAGKHGWHTEAVEARQGSGRCSLGRLLLVSCLLSVGLAGLSVPRASAQPTNRGDVARSAWYPDQAGLSPDVVTSGSFGQLFATQLQGWVMAQPIVVGDVVFAATEDNWIYGLDRASGEVLWSRKVGEPVLQSATQGCADLINSGITSTPVASPDGSAVYFTAKSYVSGRSGPMQYQLHAVHPDNGQELAGYPVTYAGVADNDSSWAFDATNQTQRPGLLLDQGVVYAAFGSVCDLGQFSGWVIGVDVASRQTTARWVSEAGEPPTAEGGIWQSGTGLASDGPGQILLVTGNGNSPDMPTPGKQAPGALGESVVRLQVGGDRKLRTTDFFTPTSAPLLNVSDADFGSGGVIPLPAQPFSTPDHPRLLASIGKEGILYLLDAADLGGAGTGVAGGDRVAAEVGGLGGVWGSPTAFPGGAGYLYLTSSSVGGATGTLTALQWDLDAQGKPSLSVAGRAEDAAGFGSGSPVVTSSGSDPSSAIIWQTWRPTGSGPSELRAYRAVPDQGVLQELWAAPIGNGAKFMSPAVADNRLYLGNADGMVYGFGSPTAQAFSASSADLGTVPVGSSASGSLSLTANRALTLTAVGVSGSAFSVGSSGLGLPRTLAAGERVQLPVTFNPPSPGSTTATLTLSVAGEPSQRLSLRGQGIYPQGHLAWQQRVVDLGTATLGGPPAAASAVLTNNGATAVTVASQAFSASPFSLAASLVGTTIAPGAQISVPLSMATTTLGSFATTLSVASAAGQSAQLNVLGTVGTASIVTISPSQVSFGSVPVGQTVTRTLTLTNTGSTSAAVTISKPPGLAASQITSLSELPEGSTIPPNGVVKLTLQFAPTSTGFHSDTWAISTGDVLGRRGVALSGTGVASKAVPTLMAANTKVAYFQTEADLPVFINTPSSSPVSFTAQTQPGSAPFSAYSALRPQVFTIPAGASFVLVPVTVHPDQGVGTTFQLKISQPRGAKVLRSTATATLLGPSEVMQYSALVGDAAASVNQADDQVVRVAVHVTPSFRPPQLCQLHTVDGTATAAAGDYVPVSQGIVTVPWYGVAYLEVKVPASRAAYRSKSFGVVLDGCSNTTIDRGVASVTLYGQAGTPSVLEASAATTVLRADAPGHVVSAPVVLTNVGGATLRITGLVQPAQGSGLAVTSAQRLTVKLLPGQTTRLTATWNGQGSSTGAQAFQVQLAGGSTMSLGLLGRLR